MFLYHSYNYFIPNNSFSFLKDKCLLAISHYFKYLHIKFSEEKSKSFLLFTSFAYNTYLNSFLLLKNEKYEFIQFND